MNITAEQLTPYIFIDVEHTGFEIRIWCNHCTTDDEDTLFYRGRDTSLPSTTWLAKLAEHVITVHGKELT